MFAKSFLIVALPLLSVACSGDVKPGPEANAAGGSSPGAAGTTAAGSGAGNGGSAMQAVDNTLIIPPSLQVMQREGVNSVFDVVALTLRQDGPKGPQILAAVRNDGDGPGCSPSFAVELYDKDGQSIGAGISGLLVQQFFRLKDGSDTLAACVTPGELTMATVDSLAMDVPIENVAQIIYWSSYWGLDLDPLGDLSVTGIESKTSGTGVAFTGTLVNHLDVPLAAPSVAVFPVNDAGRPLDIAVSAGTTEVPPAGSWAFETSPVTHLGAAQVAFPAGGP